MSPPQEPRVSLLPNATAEQLLTRWRERLLTGVIGTSIAALVPACAIHIWQASHGIVGASSGSWISLVSIVLLTALAFWPAPYRLRAAILLGIGFAAVATAVFLEGFAPAQCVLVGLMGTVSAVLYSTRIAAWVIAGSAACMSIAALLFNRGVLAPISTDHMDVTNPANWLRVGLYTLFASATAAIASGYLLGKLRETLQARTSLVEQLRDEIAQRERALHELERTQAQLVQAQKLEAIGQLAAGIAHDFNNTLSIVSLEAGLLARTPKAESVRRSAESLLGAAERGKQLTQQLLLYSRPPSGDRAVIDATQAFEECVGALRRLLPSEITFEVEIAPGPLVVNLQPSELHQIVLNLGINARDAMTGGGTLRLGLESTTLDADGGHALGLAPGRYVVLTCRDSGCGMSTATLSRIFEPFFSTKGPGRGTGLGLTNVWNIAKRVHGHVTVASALHAGTTLRVYLPLSAATLTAADESPVGPLPWQVQETVLVVEDDSRIRALLVATLSDAGYQVLDAPNVDAALALESAHAGSIDVVCTDAVMPGRQARELVAELRLRRPDAGILVCSGYSEDEQITRGIRSGEFKHLGKPFTRGELLAAVRAALERTSAPPA